MKLALTKLNEEKNLFPIFLFFYLNDQTDLIKRTNLINNIRMTLANKFESNKIIFIKKNKYFGTLSYFLCNSEEEKKNTAPPLLKNWYQTPGTDSKPFASDF